MSCKQLNLYGLPLVYHRYEYGATEHAVLWDVEQGILITFSTGEPAEPLS